VDNELNIQEKAFLGSGWSFPVTFSKGNNRLDLTTFDSNVKESIDVIMQTFRGQRPFQPEFGSGMQQFFFQKMTSTLKGDIQEEVKSALLVNEPRITVQEVSVIYSDAVTGLVEIHIDYVFNRTNTRHNYVYPFYLKEGTNL
jgi:phage baseplate assembly protein W